MELTTQNLIKIVIGVLVFVIVVLGIYFFFKDYVIDFFKNMGGNKTADQTAEIILGILK
jgi:hypothetical protein